MPGGCKNSPTGAECFKHEHCSSCYRCQNGLCIHGEELGFDTTGCELCGNRKIDDREQCDGKELRGKTCSNLPNFDSGELVCSNHCTYDTIGCGVCKNGKKDGSEQCDGTDLGGIPFPVKIICFQ